MELYHYSFSYYLRNNREIFVQDAMGEIVFVLKQNRFLLLELKRQFSNFVKYTYRIYHAQDKRQLFLIHGHLGRYLQINDEKEKIKIKQKRMQLIEKKQQFIIGDHFYSFEVDATRKASLQKNDQLVATAEISNQLQSKEDYHIVVEAVDAEHAALCIVCFQNFHLASYESKLIQ
ncbi:MAG: hypothetical protein KBT36_12805 [Kurthia sp.]|nr:hypothetical protein [Candidatus Kurthia equi]